MRQDLALPAPVVWTCPQALWGLLAAAGAALLYVFHPALGQLYEGWMAREEYSFGILVPFISLFLLWQRRDRLAAARFEPDWLGVGVLAAGIGVGALAYLATASTFAQYAFLVSLAGLALAFVGRRQFGLVAAPLGMLVFMLPLPELFLKELSAALQLHSSQLGVWLIRLAGVSVYLEGNVIDLGTMKLQVVEACSGLRYLLPLMTLGFITAYFFRAPWWQRLLLVASTLPITLLMNSARIALIGITAEHFGRAAAEGLLHDFEGWAVFMVCMAALFAEMWLLARLSGRGFREVFGIELPGRAPDSAERRVRAIPRTLAAAAALLAGVALAYALAPQPASVVPQRRGFAEFPLTVGEWRGRYQRMNPIHLDILKLDDYLLANYADGAGALINVYMGYYAVQRHGLAAHSPTECLPADGWEMQRFERHVVRGVRANGMPLEVNRVVIQKGESRQLVYYWFKQRERHLAGEYAVKAALTWDLLARQRSDGALVRLITPLARGEPAGAAEARLTGFAARVVPLLPEFVPGEAP
jgi:exosortase D (VPLPA-CTERM-specific)